MNLSWRGLTPVMLAAALSLPSGVASYSTALQNAPTARPPAPSLTRPTPPPKPPNAAGFLQRWLVLEPVRVPGQLTESAVRAAIQDAALPPSAVPRDGETLDLRGTTVTWRGVDTLAYNVNLFHFAYALDKPTSNVLFWVATVVHAPQELKGVRLAIGSNAASVWWIDDQEVIALYNDRQTVIDDGVSKRLTLKPGPHVVRAAIVNAGGATDFCARFLDGSDRPIARLTTTLSDARR